MEMGRLQLLVLDCGDVQVVRWWLGFAGFEIGGETVARQLHGNSKNCAQLNGLTDWRTRQLGKAAVSGGTVMAWWW
ncbi:hypothetical protein M0R45_006486 [Rubus argutus]|uniref:Uncharacterized protein n=1 Tax=Rubus argutus TaxID=59490 RepID=A0AAW1YQZ6_RUBAR